jgi:hypothetical protein
MKFDNLLENMRKTMKISIIMSVPCMYSNLYLLNANHMPYRSQKLPRYVFPQFIIMLALSHNLYVLLISCFNTYRAVTSNKAIPTFLHDTRRIDNIGKGTMPKTFLIYDHCTTQHWIIPSTLGYYSQAWWALYCWPSWATVAWGGCLPPPYLSPRANYTDRATASCRRS